MIRHLSNEEERKLRRRLFVDPVFVMSYQAIKDCCPQYTDLSPVEIWCAASDFTNVLLKLVVPEEEVDYEVEFLEKELGKDAFFIFFISALQLSALSKKKPVMNILLPLARHYIHHDLYHSLFSQVYIKEQDEILAGRQLDFMKYELEEIANENISSEEDKAILREYIQKAIEIGDFDELKSFERILERLNGEEGHKGDFNPELDLLRKEMDSRVAMDRTPRNVTFAKNVYKDNSVHEDKSFNNILSSGEQIAPAAIMEYIKSYNNQQKQLS